MAKLDYDPVTISFDHQVVLSKEGVDRLIEAFEDNTPPHPELRFDLATDERMEANRRLLDKYFPHR